MWSTFPVFGSSLILAVMVVASYTFAVAMAAGRSGRIKTLMAARFGAYGTVALVSVAVLCLAYAFVSHDFRLRYVAHHSDRSMSLAYLLSALWGGQDGSLLWWLFLLAGYIGVSVHSVGRKHLELQPYVIATLMGIVIFFCVLMAFAANPFATGISGARADGEGLNPFLQTFLMIVHPPSLYAGFVGCAIPFAYCIAALATGRLDATWIQASRKFSLFALLFLAIGNTLGMLWAYEELGWGGYWGWDPVENAAFMPMLSLAAFVHSVMIQERRGMLKVWNVFLICLTFFMTIFGTFLTRSGVIASVHSFAQSSIGDYFLWFLALVAAFCFTLALYRWPELRDLTPTPRLRSAAITTGWVTLAGFIMAWVIASKLGGEAAASNLTDNSRRTMIQTLAFSLLAGGMVFAAVELVFRRMTKGLDLTHARSKFESIWSREFTFLLNNYGLLVIMFFILVMTTFPMMTEALLKEKVSVGPPVFNAFMQPLGLAVFFLMGLGTLFGWKKTSEAALKKNFALPFGAMLVSAALHLALGKSIGYPAVLWSPPIWSGPLGSALQAFNAITPVLGLSLVVFNVVVIAQEFVLLYNSRVASGAEKTPWALWALGVLPGLTYSLASLPASGRRRYGGYVVHLGIVLMFLGFTGKSWTLDKDTTLAPGQTVQVDRFTLQYVGPRIEVDNTKRMLFADVRVFERGAERGRLAPAKFIYKKMPESPTTEVSILHTIRDDLYLVGSVNLDSKVASLQIHLNPLVSWIWFGALVLIYGSIICMWPELEPDESRAWRTIRGAGAIATSISLGVLLALMPTSAFAQQTETQHAGSVHMENFEEKQLFGSLRCMCGSCPRELLSTCACSTADETRERLRSKLSRGEKPAQIMKEYVNEYGTASLAIPPNEGALRALYVVPVVALVGSGIGLAIALRRWRANAEADAKPSSKKGATAGEKAERDAYDDRIDAELRELDV